MDSGFYAACSALKTQTNALEIAANNISNVSTVGFRGQIPSFEAVLAENGTTRMTGWEHLVNQHSVLNGSRLDLGQGNLERTGDPMNFAIEGPGFFAVKTKAGTMYTRNGNFQVSASGQLVTAAGDPVLGVSGPITVPGGDLSISLDGTISVGGGVAGKLQIVEFSSASALTPAGSTYYSAPKGAEKVAIASSVHQGMLEWSNVSPVVAMVGLISAERQAEMMERAMTAIDLTFNRIAADELPRTT